MAESAISDVEIETAIIAVLAHNLSAAVDVTLTVGSTTVVNWPNHGQRRNDCFMFLPGPNPLPPGVEFLSF
jgi:hypothetical protein